MKNSKSQTLNTSNHIFNKEIDKILPINKFPFGIVEKNRFNDHIHIKMKLLGKEKKYNLREKNECMSRDQESLRSNWSFERYKENANSFRCLKPDIDIYCPKKLNRTVDSRIFGSATGSISNLINITSYGNSKYMKKYQKPFECQIFKPLAQTKFVDKREKLNRIHKESAAGILNKNKYDELKNYFTDKITLEHNNKIANEDYYKKQKLNRSNYGSLQKNQINVGTHQCVSKATQSKLNENDVEINYKNDNLRKYQKRIELTLMKKAKSKENFSQILKKNI